jgi:hypothetical protein
MGTVTNIKVQPMEVTWGGTAMGFTEGDIELSLTEDHVDVTAHQEGTNILSAIRTGKHAELSLSLKETNTTLMKYILGQSGITATASGGSVAVIGWGSNRDFTPVLSQANKLILHPVANAASAKSEDICAWKAYPVPESFSFSGENPSVLNVTFKIFPDTTKANKVRLLVIGDHATGTFATVT